MPVQLKGNCHCGAVCFSLQSTTLVPYQLCVCSICRKLGIEKGQEFISVYSAVMNSDTPEESIASSERVCVMVDRNPDYVRLPEGPMEVYEKYGLELLESWHGNNGLYS
ncbi:hypothetical protein B0H14DRAFT_3086750 [Mycena olivaceomarginata]|nr:hypothetical protein B0H14DRAFT_3086750 [Mycena olivaceomarginata]